MRRAVLVLGLFSALSPTARNDSIHAMIRVFSSYITRKDMDLVLSRMVEDAVGPGDFNSRFAKAIRDQFGFEYAVALRSPHTAIQRAFKICGLGQGSKVAVSALAPSWHLAAVEDAGYVPIVLDVEEGTLHPSKEAIESANPSAVLLFDVLGKMPPSSLLQSPGIPVIEDISQVSGNITESASSNTFAYFAVWGFENDSPIATGGGALLCARGKRDGQILRSMEESLPFELKMTDYNAALGVSQLKSFPQMTERRKAIYEILSRQLARTRHAGLKLGEGESTTLYAFPVFAEGSSKEIIEYARKHGVQAELAFSSSPAMIGDDAASRFPVARSIALRCVLFPMHHKLSNQQVDQIGKIIATLP